MTAEDFARIEEELSLTLPESLREIWQRPEFLGEPAGFQEFSGDADEIIGLTLELRRDGFYGAKWPAPFLALGEDGGGNSYFTDVNRSMPAVFLAEHEMTTNKRRLITSESYETFAAFLNFVIRLQSETDAVFGQEDVDGEALVKKPWWKLW